MKNILTIAIVLLCAVSGFAARSWKLNAAGGTGIDFTTIEAANVGMSAGDTCVFDTNGGRHLYVSQVVNWGNWPKANTVYKCVVPNWDTINCEGAYNMEMRNANSTFINLQFIRKAFAGEYSGAVYLNGADSCTFDNCTFKDLSANTMYIAKFAAGSGKKGVLFKNCYMKGRNTINNDADTAAINRYITYDGCTIYSPLYMGNYTEFKNCIVYPGNFESQPADGALHPKIHDCWFKPGAVEAINHPGTKLVDGFEFYNNVVDTNKHVTLMLDGMKNTKVYNNILVSGEIYGHGTTSGLTYQGENTKVYNNFFPSRNSTWDYNIILNNATGKDSVWKGTRFSKNMSFDTKSFLFKASFQDTVDSNICSGANSLSYDGTVPTDRHLTLDNQYSVGSSFSVSPSWYGFQVPGSQYMFAGPTNRTKLVQNIGTPNRNGTAIAIKDSLASYLWYDDPIKKDSATVYIQDSTLGVACVAKDSAVMVRAGWADSLRFTTTVAGMHYLRPKIVSSVKSGSIVAYGAFDSILVPAQGPTISAQPANVSVISGATAAFSVTATGTGTLVYQWYKKTQAGSFATVGTNSASYSYTATTDFDSVKVAITDDNGTTTSNTVYTHIYPRYVLTVSTTGSGTSTGSGTYDSASVVAIDNTPNPGHAFKTWGGLSGGTLGSAATVKSNTFTITGTATATATDTLCLLHVPPPEGGIAFDKSHTDIDNLIQMRYDATTLWHAEKLIPTISGKIARIDWNFYKYGTPTGKVWTQICSNNSGAPGSALITSDSLDVASISTFAGGNWYTFKYAPTCSLTAGVTYWIKFDANYTLSSSNHLISRIDQGSDNTFGFYNGTSFSSYNTASAAYREYVYGMLTPIPGHRVWQHLNAYSAYDSIRHTVYLPTDYDTTKRWPLVVELPGNLNNAAEGAGETGLPIIGYGITKGQGAIWANMPFMAATEDSVKYGVWENGSYLDYPTATLKYAYRLLDTLKKSYKIDTTRMLLCGFSRGGEGVSVVGLAEYDTLYKQFSALWYCSGTDGQSLYTVVNYNNRNKRMRNVTNTPVMITWGDQDDSASEIKTFWCTDSILTHTFRSPTTMCQIAGYAHDNTWLLDTSKSVIPRKWLADVFNKTSGVALNTTAGYAGGNISFTATHGLKRKLTVAIGGKLCELDTNRYDTALTAYAPRLLPAGTYSVMLTTPDTVITWVNQFTINKLYNSAAKRVANITIPANATQILKYVYCVDLSKTDSAFRANCRNDYLDVQVSRIGIGLLHREISGHFVYFTDTLSGTVNNTYTLSCGSGKIYPNDREVWVNSDYCLVRHFEDQKWLLSDATGIYSGSNDIQDTAAGLHIKDTGYLGYGIKNNKTGYITDGYVNELCSATKWTFSTWVNITDMNAGNGHLFWNDDGAGNRFEIETGLTDTTFYTFVYKAGTGSYYTMGTSHALKTGWHLFTWVYDGSKTNDAVYVDNAKIPLVVQAGTMPSSLNATYGKNFKTASLAYTGGNFDELMCNTRALDSVTVMAQYKNVVTPDNFYTIETSSNPQSATGRRRFGAFSFGSFRFGGF